MGRGSLFVSDLDGTLLGDAAALERFASWFTARRKGFLLAYASGRFFDSIVEAVRDSALPEPDAVIGGVGTEIVSYESGSRVWSPAYGLDKPWDPERIRIALRGERGLTLQPSALQSAFKISYYLHDAGTDRLEDIRRTVRATGVAADIIYSSNRDLDVLPQGVNKGSAVARLARWAGIAPPDVIVAGDTGNDLSMFEHGFCGIVVGNAQPSLRALTGDRVYLARGSCADGVLEGLDYWTSKRNRNEPAGPDVSKGDRSSAHERDGSGVQRM